MSKTLTPRQFKAQQAAFYEAAVRFAAAHDICDRLDALSDGSEEKITDAEHRASCETYNETKAELMAVYRRLTDAEPIAESHRARMGGR